MANDLIEVDVNKAALARLGREMGLAPIHIKKAQVRAINRTAVGGRRMIADRVQQEVTATGLGANKFIQINRARFNAPWATIEITGKQIPLIKFDARKGKAGVRYRIMKGDPLKTLKHSFIATAPKRGRQVWLRSEAARDSIRKRLGTSIPKLVGDIRELAKGILERTLEARLGREIDHELDFQLSRIS